MCPSVLGRVETRTFILTGPAIIGLVLSLITGNEGYIVLIGVYLLLGVALDTCFYPFIIKWQPPWLTFVLGCGEFVLLFLLGKTLEVGLTDFQAVWFFWLSWVTAVTTRIVVLPILSLSWIENGGEFRIVGWTVVPEMEQHPVLVAADPNAISPGKLAREFSSVHEIPDDLRRAPSLSGAHTIPT